MKKKLRYYVRSVYKREPINHFGKLGYVLHDEFVKTANIERFNYKKKIKFAEINRPSCLVGAKKDTVVSMANGRKW
jgi:hypothetical protein